MKFTSLFGQAFRTAKVSEPPGGTHIPTLIKAMEGRYGFMQFPSSFDLSKGVVFSHGIFKERNMVIDSLNVYANALFVNTRSSTEDADLFLDDVVQWANSTKFVVITTELPERRTYASHLEFTVPTPLESWFPSSPVFDFISKQVTGLLHGQGRETPPFQIAGFAMLVDPATPNPPTTFTFEKRAGLPWSANTYYSAAPLSTPDHIDLLETVIKMVAKK